MRRLSGASPSPSHDNRLVGTWHFHPEDPFCGHGFVFEADGHGHTFSWTSCPCPDQGQLRKEPFAWSTSEEDSILSITSECLQGEGGAVLLSYVLDWRADQKSGFLEVRQHMASSGGAAPGSAGKYVGIYTGRRPLYEEVCHNHVADSGGTSVSRRSPTSAVAVLSDGCKVEYVVDPARPMEDGTMVLFLTVDRSSVVGFFKRANPTQSAKLDAIVGKFNPMMGAQGAYWQKIFCCWPTGIIVKPQLGVVCPVVPQNFIFKDGPFKGQQKELAWFTGKTGSDKPLRDLLPESERGEWIHLFRASLMLARAVRRLHFFGVSHSDLSRRNVLIDPRTGQVGVLGWDELVVPGIFPPEVIGTPGYIAPEVLETCYFDVCDPRRRHPSVLTDLHALAVLIYELLLFRHPLKGPKLNSTESAEKDDLLSMGEKALFIEHPTDRSNRPPDKDLKPTYDALGPHLVALFNQAFIDGLHAPDRRPIASAWERAFQKTWNLLHPCANPACTHKWFVVWQKAEHTCPFCGTKVAGTVLKLNFRKEVAPGKWVLDGELVVYHGTPIKKWHVFDNVFPNETLTDAERGEVLADCQLYNGKWLLINRKLGHMVSPGGNQIPPKSAIELKPGAKFHLSTEPHGRIAEVEPIQQGDE